MDRIKIEQLWDYSDDRILIDVRSPSEFKQAHIPNALNLPLFTDDERVHQHLPAFEQIDQFEVCSAKVIDPYRGVDQNQRLVFSRRRGATVSDG